MWGSMEKVIVAIDPSITGSGIAIKSGRKRYLYSYSEHWKKDDLDITNGDIRLILKSNRYKDRNCRSDVWRYMHTVANLFSFIDAVCAKEHCIKPYFVIENYSFGSKGGLAFSIGEFVGMIKANVALRRWDVNVLAPTDVKKVFSGKGNSDKTAMLEAAKINAPGLITIYDKIKERYPKLSYDKSPLADITDAYAICETFLKTINNM